MKFSKRFGDLADHQFFTTELCVSIKDLKDFHSRRTE